MSTPVQIPFNQSNSNGVLTSFTYNWLTPTSGEMKVFFKEDGQDQIEVNPSQYTVNGVGVSGGGTVDFTSPPATGIVTLLRVTSLDQDYVIPPTGALDRAGLEGALDKLMRQQQETQAVIDNQVIKTAETDTGGSTIVAQDLLDAATEADASATAAAASEASAAASAGVATGVAATIESDADTAVTNAVNAQVPGAVTTEVNAQVSPAVDTAVNDAVNLVVPDVAESTATQTTTDYLDANLNARVDSQVESVATPIVQDVIADEVPPAVQTEVTRVVAEETIDIQQSQATELVDDAFKGRQRDNAYETSEQGGIMCAMDIRNTIVVPHRHRLFLLADSIASGAEIIIENGAEVVHDPNNLTFTAVNQGRPPAITKVDLANYNAQLADANTTTTINGTTDWALDTVANVGWKEADTHRIINVGASTCSITDMTGVTFVPAGPYTLAPGEQIMLELVDETANNWYVTKP